MDKKWITFMWQFCSQYLRHIASNSKKEVVFNNLLAGDSPYVASKSSFYYRSICIHLDAVNLIEHSLLSLLHLFYNFAISRGSVNAPLTRFRRHVSASSSIFAHGASPVVRC